MNELEKLLLDELADIHHAETQLTKFLPKAAKAAQSADLREVFETHLEETENQVDRLRQVFEALNEKPKMKKCKAMEGLIAEAKEIMSEHEDLPSADAAMIAAAQKIEHYEIASYGCLCTWAKLLGHDDAQELLQETLDEESAADEKLTQVAESSINAEATHSGEEEEEMEPASNARRGSSRSRKVATQSRRR